MTMTDLPSGVTVEKLDNGLTLILQRLSYSPVAAVCVSYRVGPLWETAGSCGMSHFW